MVKITHKIIPRQQVDDASSIPSKGIKMKRNIGSHKPGVAMVLEDVRKLNQSINQSNFYSTNIPGIARLSGATARSAFKYEVVEAIP